MLTWFSEIYRRRRDLIARIPAPIVAVASAIIPLVRAARALVVFCAQPIRRNPRVSDLSFAAAWAVLSFAVSFYFAGRIPTIGWNAIELIIANNLRDFGLYVTGLGYPTAVWRPVLPTFVVAVVDGTTSDPLLTFQIIAGMSIATFVTSAYFTNRLFSGPIIANIGAALAFINPAISIRLLNHLHSWSNLVLIGLLGPTIYFSAQSLLALSEPTSSRRPRLATAGFFWGLCFLARSETFLAAAVFFCAALFLAMRKRQLKLILRPLAVYLMLLLPFVFWSANAAKHYDLTAGKFIYQFYNSQGWSDLESAGPGIDVEREGFIRASELYGTPEDNNDSVIRAIAHNPLALVSRIAKNARALFRLLNSKGFMSLDLLLLMLLAPLTFFFQPYKTLFAFGYLSYLSVTFLLLLHIDQRYVTLCIPFAVFVASLTIWQLGRLPMPAALGQNAIPLLILIVLTFQSINHVKFLPNNFAASRLDLSPMRALAGGFLDLTSPSREQRGKFQVYLDIDPLPASARGEDFFMFYYFSHTSLVQYGAEDIYPRGRIFSYRTCPFTHAVSRSPSFDKLPPAMGPKGEKLGSFNVPNWATFYVYRLAGAGC